MNGSETEGTPSPPIRRKHGNGWWVALGVAVAVVIVVAVPLEWGHHASSPPPPPPPSFPTVNATFDGTNGSTTPLATGFLGVNVRADVAFTSSSGQILNSTGARFVRWPGGGDGDRLDPLANGDRGVIYSDSGGAVPANTTFAEFVRWCESVACHSVVTLPGEVDNASMAAAIVSYSETTLGFRPTYWEIGNEPAQWDHFGIPWSRWNATQSVDPTPAEFASLVQSYVRAIRAIDATTGIIGLGGIGPTSLPTSDWITTTASVDGPNLSALAIHVYPAGTGFPASDLRDWYATLTGHMSLPYRVPKTLGEMASACPTCHLGLLVDEFQTGTSLTPANTLTGGYLATFVAAELVQALPLPIESVDYYNFQSGTAGAWLDPNGVSSPALVLYQALASDFGSFGVQLNVSSLGGGLLAAEGGTSAASLDNLLLVNINSTTGFRVDLSGFPDAAHGSAWVFNGSASGPVTLPLNAVSARNWTVPPASLVILMHVGAAGAVVPHSAPGPVEMIPPRGPPAGVRSGVFLSRDPSDVVELQATPRR